jgi:hypothetical protein
MSDYKPFGPSNQPSAPLLQPQFVHFSSNSLKQCATRRNICVYYVTFRQQHLKTEQNVQLAAFWNYWDQNIAWT